MNKALLVIALALAFTGCKTEANAHITYTHDVPGGTSSSNPEDFKSSVDFCFHQQWNPKVQVLAPNFYAGAECDAVEATAANRYWLHTQADPTFDSRPDWSQQ